MVEENKESDFTFVIEAAAKKFDSEEDILAAIGGSAEKFEDLNRAKGVKLGGNSYGYDACKYMAEQFSAHDTPLLVDIDFSDIFVSRLRAELPASLSIMAQALLPKQQLIRLNLSDNAFGPDGIKAFECLLTGMSTLEVLQVNNCGLGPEGGEMIAEALSRNEGLKLKHFEAGRDRLENKGITALGRVFADMGSLEVVHVPQNGIKDEGMSSLLSSLAQSCTKLRILRLNDNWLKSESVEGLFKLIHACSSLEHLNLSDLNMGQEVVLATLMALRSNEKLVLRDFLCNYNDVESRELALKCKDILMDDLLPRESEGRKLERIELIGCDCLTMKNRQAIKQEFADKEVSMKLYEEEEDDDDEDGDDESEGEGEDYDHDRLAALEAKLQAVKEQA